MPQRLHAVRPRELSGVMVTMTVLTSLMKLSATLAACSPQLQVVSCVLHWNMQQQSPITRWENSKAAFEKSFRSLAPINEIGGWS